VVIEHLYDSGFAACEHNRALPMNLSRRGIIKSK
jgi:hypothetical protein